MIGYPSLHLARIFFRMFLRDRQAIFFSLFFPIIFLTVFGFINSQTRGPIGISIANQSTSPIAGEFVEALSANELFKVASGEAEALKEQLIKGDETLVLVIPPDFDDSLNPTELVLYVDAAQVRLLGLIMPTLENALVDIERSLRGTTPLFRLKLEDVKARSQRYLDFLLPGIIAFTLMQISIAGSGYNLVEYRRKGILKRLFVTPIRPADFIASICMARLAWCLLQLTALLAFAVFLLDVTILGSFVDLYMVIILGTVIFLCIGFCVGSVSRTQQSVGAIGNIVVFPQLFLSGVFFPIEAMPQFLQPVARLLPLSFVVDSLRGIANDGATLLQTWPDLIGVFAWIVLSFLLATRLFVWKEVVT